MFNTTPIYVVLILLTTTTAGLAQDKFERESRINSNEVPALAVSFIDSLNTQKVKWYLEERTNDYSFEAKLKLKKQCYSIEFDTLGRLEDVEKTVKWKELDPKVRATIQLQLSKQHKRFKVKKAQIQYTGATNLILKKIKHSTNAPSLQTNYELVLKCWPKGKKQQVILYEYLFDERGIELRKSKIVFKNATNLEY
jgi:hypothetical protein